jgi:hypothetical protein
MAVRGENVFAAREGGDQYQKRRARKVEIRQELIDH